jgi:hypothetical protein
MDPTVAYHGEPRVEFNSPSPPSCNKSINNSGGDALFVRSPSISSTCLSSDPSSSSLPSSPSDDLCGEEDGELSIRSVLALYQAFYDHCGGDHRPSLNNNSNSNGDNVVLKQEMKGQASDFEDGADENENVVRGINDNGVRRTLGEQFNQMDLFDPVDEGNAAHRSSNRDGGESSTDDNNEEEEEEEKSVISVPLTPPPTMSEQYNQRRKKIGKVLLSIIALWAYSRYQQSKQEQLSRRRGIRNNIQREGTILQILHWMFRLVSPSRILNYLQLFRPRIKSMESIPRSSSSLWKNATHVPFGHLVASARAGDGVGPLYPLHRIQTHLMK